MNNPMSQVHNEQYCNTRLNSRRFRVKKPRHSEKRFSQKALPVSQHAFKEEVSLVRHVRAPTPGTGGAQKKNVSARQKATMEEWVS